MVVKFLSKYILEVIPSIVATVIGAYIVTHYINARSDADKPKAAIAAPANTAKDAGSDETAKAVEIPAPKAAKADSAKADSVATPAETVSAPAAPRRHQPMLRDKTAAKPVVGPSADTPKEAAKSETAKTDEIRDANEIARAAIERLRNSDQAKPAEVPRAQEAVRVPEAQRPQERARVNVTYSPSAPAPLPVQAPPVVPALPPATNVAPPLNEVTIAPEPQPPAARAESSFRPPTPPADIPSRPLDLSAKSQDRTSVAEDVVSTAKSVFHAVIPGTN
jgi:hypothetical protein